MIADLHRYLDESGTGMGILGELVHDELTTQIEEFNIALQNMAKNIQTLKGEDSPLLDVKLDLMNLTEEQAGIIEQMKKNSEAWAKATTEAEKARLQAENEKLASILGLDEYDITEPWYLDDTKLTEIRNKIDEIKTAQINNINEVSEENNKEFDAFKDLQGHKQEEVDNFVTNSKTILGSLYTWLENGLNNFTNKFSNNIVTIENQLIKLLNRIKEAINSLNTLNNIVIKTSNIGSITPSNVSATPQRFATGGRAIGTGFAFVEDKEIVLNNRDSETFQKLVNLINNPSSSLNRILNIQQQGVNTNRLSSLANANTGKPVIAEFNFSGDIMKDTLPEVKRMINEAMDLLPAKIAQKRFEEASRFGIG